MKVYRNGNEITRAIECATRARKESKIQMHCEHGQTFSMHWLVHNTQQAGEMAARMEISSG